MSSYEETNKKRNVLWNLIKKAMGQKKTMECVLIKRLIRKDKCGNFGRTPEKQKQYRNGSVYLIPFQNDFGDM